MASSQQVSNKETSNCVDATELKGMSILQRLSPTTSSIKSVKNVLLPKVNNESPFDNVLRTDDLVRAKTMVSVGNFVQTYPPRLTLLQYIKEKPENEGYTRTLLLLISHGIYPITSDFLEHMISHASDINILSVLNAAKNHGFSGLHGKVMHLAVKKGNLEIVKSLVSLGFDVNQLDYRKQTPIFHFIEGEDVFSKTTFYPQEQVNFYSNLYQSPAINRNDSNCYFNDDWVFQEQHENRFSFNASLWNYLVNEKKVKLNVIDDYGETPLSLSIRLQREEVMMKLLTNHCVDVDLCVNNTPPFHVYCEESRVREDIFKTFFTRVVLNRQINRINFEGRTPLHCLINNIYAQDDPAYLIPFIIKMVENSADLTKQDKKGLTPYMLATHHRFPYDVLRHLIPKTQKEAMMSLNKRNNNGHNVLALTLLRYQGETEELIEESNFVKPTMESHFNCETRKRENGDSIHSVDLNETGNSVGVVSKEVELHLLIEKLLLTGAKLDPSVESLATRQGMSDSKEEEISESMLSLLIQNKHLPCKTIQLLLKKGVICSFDFMDIWNCLLHFRLDILLELVKFAESKNGKKATARENLIFKMIQMRKGLSINILDHIYSFRHIYLQTMNEGLLSNPVGVPSLSSSASNSSLCSMNNLAAMGNDSICSRVTRHLARYNLKAVYPLIKCLVESFGHPINQVILSDKSPQEIKFTLIHSLINTHSWVPLPRVLDYVLVEKKNEIDINVILSGSGSPLNYAIRLGEFEIADQVLSMKPDISKLDLKIPVLPLKRGFSRFMRKLISLGVQIPREFGQQILSSRIEDPILEVEFLMFMDEIRNNTRRDYLRNSFGRQQVLQPNYYQYGFRRNSNFHSRKFE